MEAFPVERTAWRAPKLDDTMVLCSQKKVRIRKLEQQRSRKLDAMTTHSDQALEVDGERNCTEVVPS